MPSEHESMTGEVEANCKIGLHDAGQPFQHSAISAVGSPPLRSTQRVPYRCTQCAGRRVRCNKKMPCDQCIKRGIADQCAREIVRVGGKIKLAQDLQGSGDPDGTGLYKENAQLNTRVAQLELELAVARNRTWTELGRGRPGSQLRPSPYRTKLDDYDYVESTLDNWNFGHIETSRATTCFSDELPTHDLAYALTILLERGESTRVVDFALQHLTWIHCALRAEQARADHESFWKATELPDPFILNPEWFMLHLAILTIGYFFLATEEGNMPSRNFSNARKFYDATYRELECCGPMRKPNLSVIQTGAMLSMCHNAFGLGERERLLQGISITMARSLQMHRLGNEPSYPKLLERIPEWTTKSGREMGRRLWWTLVIIDWLEAPRTYPLVDPSGFDSVLTEAESDLLDLRGNSSYSDACLSKSPIEHHVGMARLASIVHQHVTRHKTSPNIIYRTLRELDELEGRQFEGRAKLRYLVEDLSNSTASSADLQLWQRYNFAFALRLVTLNLCRVILGPTLHSETAKTDVRRRAVLCALEVADLSGLEAPRLFKMPWNVCSATLAAGVFLALELISTNDTRSPERVERLRAAILTCKEALRTSEHTTFICRHGLVVLDRLLRLQETWQSSEDDINCIIRKVMEQEGLSESANPHASNKSLGSPVLSGSSGMDMMVPMEELFSTGLDSGEILDDFFQFQEYWAIGSDEVLTNP